MNKLLILLVWLSVYAAPTAVAQTTDCWVSWQSTMQLSSPGINSYTPNIVTQGDTIHLVYEGNGLRLPYRRSTDGGANWCPIRDLIIDTITFPFPVGRSFPVSNGSQLFIFFIGGIDGSGDSPIFMLRSSDRGDTWSDAEAITAQNGYIQNAAVLGDTIAIAGYIDPIDHDWIISSTDAGTTWTLTEVPFYTNDPRVALSPGWLHFAYSYFIQGCSFEQLYRRSSDLGVTWSDSVMLSTCDNRGGGTPAIAATSEGNMFISWTDAKFGCSGFGCGILFRRSTDHGGTWLDEQVLTDTPWGEASKLSSGSGGTLGATWSRTSTLFHIETRTSTDLGASWCPIVDLTPLIPQWGKAVYSNIGIAHSAMIVAWEQTDTTGTTSPFYIEARVGTLPPVSVDERNLEYPASIHVFNPYPNPFNVSTRITYILPVWSRVRLAIYNLLGERVTLLMDGIQDPGSHDAVWNAAAVASGVYFYRFTTDRFISTGKLLLLK